MFSVQVLLLSLLHSYFFAFGEMDYNTEEKVYELSISSIAHDFEDHMEKKGINLGHIEHIDKKDTLFASIEEELNKGFIVTPENGESITFRLLGLEVDLKDNLTFYLRSSVVEPFENAKIDFSLMMETFENQQNKLNYLHNGKRHSLTFIRAKSTRTLSL